MKKRKKIIITLVSSLFLFIFYFLFFPYETEKEIKLKPSLVHNLGKNDIASPPYTNGKVYSFKLENIFGFLNEKGEILYTESVLYDVAVSDHGFIDYSSIQNVNQSLILMDVQGNYRQSYSIPGYPFFSDNGSRLFIIKTNATGIREVSFEGEQLWQADFSSLITSFSSNDEYALAGLLNGMMKVFNRSGEVIYNYNPEAGRLTTIYGTAAGKNSIAVISGINPQQLLFFKKGKDNFHKPVKKESQETLRRPAYMNYTNNDAYLLFESNQKLNTMDIKSLKTYSFPANGRLTSIDTHKLSQLIAASFLNPGSNKIAGLYLCKPPNMVFIKEHFNMKIKFIRFIKDQVVIGFNEILLVFNIMEV